MATCKRHWQLVSLILAALVCGAGCNGLTLPYFLFQRLCGEDANLPPLMAKLASSDKKKVVKVVVIASSNLQAQPEFLTIDRDLTTLFIRRLQQSYKDNKENVVLLPATKVERFKDTHPNWALDVPSIGKHFKADWVVWLQIDSFSLYEPRSHNMIYQAHANIQVSLFDMSQADAAPQEKSYVAEFPRGGERPVDGYDPNPLPFQQSFLDHIAKDLCHYLDEYDGQSQIDIPSPMGFD
jgi:hypothetical protein